MYPEEGEPRLTELPPELSEHLLQFLPSLSLLQLPLLDSQLGRQARKEVEARHARLDKTPLKILTEISQPADILNTISMLCPGLVLLYDSSMAGQRYETVRKVGDHSIVINTQQPLFSTTNTR